MITTNTSTDLTITCHHKRFFSSKMIFPRLRHLMHITIMDLVDHVDYMWKEGYISWEQVYISIGTKHLYKPLLEQNDITGIKMYSTIARYIYKYTIGMNIKQGKRTNKTERGKTDRERINKITLFACK